MIYTKWLLTAYILTSYKEYFLHNQVCAFNHRMLELTKKIDKIEIVKSAKSVDLQVALLKNNSNILI